MLCGDGRQYPPCIDTGTMMGAADRGVASDTAHRGAAVRSTDDRSAAIRSTDDHGTDDRCDEDGVAAVPCDHFEGAGVAVAIESSRIAGGATAFGEVPSVAPSTATGAKGDPLATAVAPRRGEHGVGGSSSLMIYDVGGRGEAIGHEKNDTMNVYYYVRRNQQAQK